MSERDAGPGQEPDRVDGRDAALAVAGSVGVVVAFCLAAWLVLGWVLDDGEAKGAETDTSAATPSGVREPRLFGSLPHPDSADPSAAETELLETWGRVGPGRVRIPISEAMRVLVEAEGSGPRGADTARGADTIQVSDTTRMSDTAAVSDTGEVSDTMEAAAMAGLSPEAEVAGPGSPPAMEDVDVTEQRGATVPLEARVVDEAGGRGRLGPHVATVDGPPVVLAPVYYRCRTLCGLVMEGLARGLGNSSLEPGRDYRVVTLGIDPRESPADLSRRRERLLRAVPDRDVSLAAAAALPAWTLLRGADQDAVRRVADAVGFGYRYDARSDQFAHAAVVMILTPDGRVADYLYGVRFEAGELERAVARAGRGEVAEATDAGTGALERALLRCFRYTPALRRHAGLVANLLRGGGGLILLGAGLLIGLSVRRELRRRERPA